MQNKTTSAFVESPGPHPLADVLGIQTIREHANRLLNQFPLQTTDFIEAICGVTERLFTGQFWSYQPIDLRYHDFLHTLQAAQTYLDLAESAQKHLSADKRPSVRELELGFAAILLHDTGYLKVHGDDEGTGAKYTHCHVLRSCALAASVLPSLGCIAVEISDILGAIRSTGLQGNPADTAFSTEAFRFVACMVATSDYIGQMAAPDYPEKLTSLFSEFDEADDYNGTPKDRRAFKSPAALLDATPSFWSGFVLPRMNKQFAGAYALLASPYPSGANPYLAAITHNIELIAARSSTAGASSLASA